MARGRLFARLAHVNGKTRLVEHHQSAPLKIARTFQTDAGGLEVCIMDASPGLLAGDAYDLEWIIEPGARVRVTTQGATRVHPSSGACSRQNTRVRVAAGGVFEWWPEAVIPFCDAHFQSYSNVYLETGATLRWFESLSSGRVARGESFAFDLVETRLQVRDERGPLLCTQNRFAPREMALRNPLSWGAASNWANFYSFGQSDFDSSGSYAFALKSQLDVARAVLGSHALPRASVSALARGGIGVSLLGDRPHDTRQLALQIEKRWREMASVSRET